MKKELEEKEAKYAEMDATVERQIIFLPQKKMMN